VKRALLCALLCAALTTLGGCGGGGQEIEGRLFVLAMAVDPAEGGNLTVTVKALSGTQEAAAPQGGGQEASGDSSGQDGQSGWGGEGAMRGGQTETVEPGYVTLSATADSCLSALHLLSATTPRSVDLSQLREIVINETLARTDATLTILREIHALYEANGEAVVVVTPDDAGDFIRRQYAMFGIRLSQYLEVLFDHFAEQGTIPAGAMLSTVIGAMESGTIDAAAVYAAGNAFDAPLVMNGDSVTDRLPGHLPRTSPAINEYLGSAIFSGARMTGTLTGDETGILRMASGKALSTSITLGGGIYQISTRTRVRRGVTWEDGRAVLELSVSIRMALSAGAREETAMELAGQIERAARELIEKLQSAGSDALGFGRLAVRRYPDIASWEASGWPDAYRAADARVTVDIAIQ